MYERGLRIKDKWTLYNNVEIPAARPEGWLPAARGIVFPGRDAFQACHAAVGGQTLCVAVSLCTCDQPALTKCRSLPTRPVSPSRTTRPGRGLRGGQRRVGLSTPIDGPKRSVVDCRIKRVSAVGVAGKVSVMDFHWICGETHLVPPVALLKYEHTSCEKQSWVLLTSSSVNTMLPESGVELHTRHFLLPCLSNPLRIGHCTNSCFGSDFVLSMAERRTHSDPMELKPKLDPTTPVQVQV